MYYIYNLQYFTTQKLLQFIYQVLVTLCVMTKILYTYSFVILVTFLGWFKFNIRFSKKKKKNQYSGNTRISGNLSFCLLLAKRKNLNG